MSTTVGTGAGRGLDLYYERAGSGAPLVLLHGALGTIESCFAELRPKLERSFDVVAVELEGHGRTPAPDRPLSYAQMSADVGALMHRLDIAPAHIVGYSMGGAVAMELALTRPGLVDRLVQFGGVSFSPAGDHPASGGDSAQVPDDRAQPVLASLEGSRWHEGYLAVAPHAEDWAQLVGRVAALDEDFGWTEDTVASLSRPTLLMNGDADITRLKHVIDMFCILGGGNPGDLQPPSWHRLAIIPGATHVGLLDRSDLLDDLITAFLTEDVGT